MTKEGVDELAGAILSRVPMKRLGKGEDIANAVALALRSSGFSRYL
jgi:hypothetical protein